ncbi:hypothetical protein BASA61_005782 [Batrachochytrium salamandrivorans]|nr:hypothetical protein BASA61_005782 [Batrachochytrium salamandrivorans]
MFDQCIRAIDSEMDVGRTRCDANVDDFASRAPSKPMAVSPNSVIDPTRRGAISLGDEVVVAAATAEIGISAIASIPRSLPWVIAWVATLWTFSYILH